MAANDTRQAAPKARAAATDDTTLKAGDAGAIDSAAGDAASDQGAAGAPGADTGAAASSASAPGADAGVVQTDVVQAVAPQVVGQRKREAVAIEVISRRDGFWRGDRQWTTAPQTVRLNELTRHQLAEIEDEPLLITRIIYE